MKCDRCGRWHQRTFQHHNEFSEKESKIETICGPCILEIWGDHRHENPCQTTGPIRPQHQDDDKDIDVQEGKDGA